MSETAIEAPTAVKPCVYVLCFASTPYKGAKHYLGYTTLPIADRIKRHRSKYGARLIKVLLASGGDFVLADTWDCENEDEARKLEKALKAQGGGARCCSLCKPGNGRGAGRGRNRYGLTPKPARKIEVAPERPLVRGAVVCGICRALADRFANRFQCQQNPHHVGDLNMGIFSDLAAPDQRKSRI